MPDVVPTKANLEAHLPPGLSLAAFQKAIDFAIAQKLVVPLEDLQVAQGITESAKTLTGVYLGEISHRHLPACVRGLVEGLERTIKLRLSPRTKRAKQAYRPQREGLSDALRAMAHAKEARPALFVAMDLSPQHLREQADELETLQTIGERLERTMMQIQDRQRDGEHDSWELVREHWPLFQVLLPREPQLLDLVGPLVNYMTARFEKAAKRFKDNLRNKKKQAQEEAAD